MQAKAQSHWGNGRRCCGTPPFFRKLWSPTNSHDCWSPADRCQQTPTAVGRPPAPGPLRTRLSATLSLRGEKKMNPKPTPQNRPSRFASEGLCTTARPAPGTRGTCTGASSPTAQLRPCDGGHSSRSAVATPGRPRDMIEAHLWGPPALRFCGTTGIHGERRSGGEAQMSQGARSQRQERRLGKGEAVSSACDIQQTRAVCGKPPSV